MLDLLSDTAVAFGLDISSLSLQHARSRGFSTLVQGDAEFLPHAEGVFDVVLALDVIEHHDRPVGVLREISRVLRPGGTVVVTVPAYKWMWSYADDMLGHKRRYTLGELRAHLEVAGFKIERATYFHAWLVPIAWVVRRFKRLLGRTDVPDDALPPRVLNLSLGWVTALERKVLRKVNLPFGLSIVASATRTHSPSAGDLRREDDPPSKPL